MPTFTPTLTSDPNAPSYSVGLAETYSWVPQSSPNANRPIFARATYLVNPDDIKISLSASKIDVDFENVNETLDEALVKLDTINYGLTAINTDLNTNLETVNVNLSVLDIDLDIVNTNLSAVRTSLGTVNANLSALNTINANLSVLDTDLNAVKSNTSRIPGFSLPTFDSISPAYYGITDNLQTVDYRLNNTLVAQLSFTYVTSPPTSNGALISNIKRTV